MKKQHVNAGINPSSLTKLMMNGVVFCIILLTAIIVGECTKQANLSFINTALANNSCGTNEEANFDKFLKKFINDTDFQRKHTQNTIVYVYEDNSEGVELVEGEPPLVTKKLTKNNVSYPVMPNKRERKEQNLNFKVYKHGKKANVTMYQDDTCYVVDYYFEFKGCWLLVKIDNS